jgi:hypothetical protein
VLRSLGGPGYLVDFYLEEHIWMYTHRMLVVEADGGFRVCGE